MKWGLIGRPEVDRGLGVQSREISRNLHPDWVLMVDMDTGFQQDLTGFTDGPMTVMQPNARGRLDLGAIQRMIRTHKIQALVTVESFYDEQLIELCKSMRVKTIDQMNPEFYRAHRDAPDVWWWPTPWMVKDLPRGPIVPVPAPWFQEVIEGFGSLRVLHVAGKHAVGDRNGTRLFIEGLSHVKEEVHVTICCQDNRDRYEGWIDHWLPANGNVSVTLDSSCPANRRAIYEYQDLMVLPRRFGGNCLPTIEAMASGLAVAMTACSPNLWWPVAPIECDDDQTVKVPYGSLTTMRSRPEAIGSLINEVARSRKTLEMYQQQSVDWAVGHSWDEMRPEYMTRLAEAIGI